MFNKQIYFNYSYLLNKNQPENSADLYRGLKIGKKSILSFFTVTEGANIPSILETLIPQNTMVSGT